MEIIVIIVVIALLFYLVKKVGQVATPNAADAVDMKANVVQEAVVRALKDRDERRAAYFAEGVVLAKRQLLTLECLAKKTGIYGEKEQEEHADIKRRYAAAGEPMMEALSAADSEQSSTEILLAAARRNLDREEWTSIPDGGFPDSAEAAEQKLSEFAARMKDDARDSESRWAAEMGAQSAARQLAFFQVIKELEDEVSFDEEYPQFAD